MAEAGVQFADVSYTLPAMPGCTDGRTLLRGISLTLEAGSTTALLGRSGSGKTTLLRMVNGLVRPSAGEVLVFGVPVSASDAIALRRGIGYVIQEAGLFPHMTVERNAGMGLELAGWPRAKADARVCQVFAMTGLAQDEVGRRYPWELSGGQRQRVGVARALALDPGILLMDEPFGALDPLTRAEMQTMLRDLLRTVRKTVLLVTHDLDEALFLADRVVLLEAGAVVADLVAGDVLQSANAPMKSYVAAVHRAIPA